MLNWEGTNVRATSEVYEKISHITRENFGKIPIYDGTRRERENFPFPFRADLDNEILISCSLTKPWW